MIVQKVTHHSAASATATGNVMNLSGISHVAVQITGTFVATVTFKATVDGTNYVAIEGINTATGAKSTTVTAAGIYAVPVAGYLLFVCDLTWTSGTSITVTGRGVDQASGLNLTDPEVSLAAGTAEIGKLAAGTALIGKVDPAYLVPNGTQADQALTVDATVGGVQFAAFHADTTHIEWDCQVAQIRVTFDNSAPTATNGHLIEVGASDVWPKAKAAAAKFIRTGGTSAVIHASQLKGA